VQDTDVNYYCTVVAYGLGRQRLSQTTACFKLSCMCCHEHTEVQQKSTLCNETWSALDKHNVPNSVTHCYDHVALFSWHYSGLCVWIVHYSLSHRHTLSCYSRRSRNSNQLAVLSVNPSTYGWWSFSVAGLTVWNSLPDNLRNYL